jgi:hypothetical protein|tara:strand:- start:89 stop:241 length:153 start_codon:yes stop_codon:yes gene_type:complete
LRNFDRETNCGNAGMSERKIAISALLIAARDTKVMMLSRATAAVFEDGIE